MKKLLFFALIICFAISTNAQIEAPAPSPFGKIEQKVGLTDISIEYSRPGVKGREIFGDLVPFGKIWRTGANMNTIISFSDDVSIGGKELKKGSYAVYTVPNEDSWEVMFYTTTDNPGLPQEWDDSKVALKATAEVEELPFEVETFTIFVNDITNDSAVIEFIWDDTIANLPFTVPTNAKTMASIERVMNGPGANDYFVAASYYHAEGKDLEKAHKWITKAVDMAGDRAFWILREKSLIEADMGKKQEAIATAKRSLASAEKAGNADYVKMNKESIKEWEGSN